MNFHLNSRLGILLIVVIIAFVTNQAAKIVDLSDIIVTVGTRHDCDCLRVLVCNTSDEDTVIIKRLRTTVCCDLDFSISNIRNLEVQNDVITGSLFTGIACGRIIVNVIQDTGDARIIDLDIRLEIIYVLSEEIFSRVDIGIGDKLQVGFTSSSRAIADLMRTLAPEMRVSMSC